MNNDGQKNLTGRIEISVDHVTIRQSISLLLFKLVVLELLAATGFALFLFFISSQAFSNFASTVSNIEVPFFLIFVFLKLGITVYIVLEWLENYYEITPHEVLHRKGFIFKDNTLYRFSHTQTLNIQFEQGVWGRFFNFGTIHLIDKQQDKTFSLYLIHNPYKYYTILEQLLPDVDEEKKVIREHVFEDEA